MSDDISQQLYDTLKNNVKPCYLNNSGTEISIRCPYCGDSIKSENSAHLYIKTDVPFFYFCQRCNTSGIVTPDFLKDIKVYDTSLATEIYNVNKTMKYNKSKKSKHSEFANKDGIFIPPAAGTKLELKKLNYINNRLGTNISLEEAVDKFRMILNFKEFILYNDIDEFTESTEMVAKLHKTALGFLSYDQSNIVFRSFLSKEESGYRYHNYNVLGNYEDSKRFYTIQSKIDIFQTELNVVATEGIIDIIGVYNHFYKDKDNSNTLFVAINGKGYNLVFNYLARLGFLKMNISIFSDSDVDISFYKYIKSQNDILSNQKIKIYYNKIGKDYGVKKEQIDLKYSII